MRRLMNVLASNRIDLGVLVTHQYKLDDIVAAYDLFAHQRDGVLKVAIKPSKKPRSICCGAFCMKW
jgi:threonine dehydrogenase-like Zn-dependent dehydrogenase